MMTSMSNNVDLARQVLGRLFITGFSGLELSNDTSVFISQADIGGVILFAPNYDSPAQVAELINQVQECRRELPLWVCVDQEGGRVQRFKKGFTRIPDAWSIGVKNSPKLAFEISEMMAKELKAVGVNVNFCPVTDIVTNPKNQVIGNRAYGDTEELVTKMSSAVVRGHLVHGVQPCVKHFPGHGDTSTDSHMALPKVDADWSSLLDRELRPFTRAFKSHCSMVMTAHILNPRIDPKFPATLSRKTLRELLRGELRYSRLIVTDDMEMKAIADHFGQEEAPCLAIEAGCDLLIYRSENGTRRAYAAVAQALENGRLAPELVIEAAARISEVKKEFFKEAYRPVAVADVGRNIGLPEHQALVDRITPQS